MKSYYLLCRHAKTVASADCCDIIKKEKCPDFYDGKCANDSKKCIVYKYVMESEKKQK